MRQGTLAAAVYLHPAFLPHRLLSRRFGRFWEQNGIVVGAAVILLTFCAWRDGSFFLVDGFGYLQHPGIWGWYLIQLVMPIAIYNTLKRAIRCGRHYRNATGGVVRFRESTRDPMVTFVGFGSSASRSTFAFLFAVGFSAFAYNTFQNLHPGVIARLDFWDSIHFRWGYFGTRLYKFYIDALLLPSIVHMFAGVVWTTLSSLRRLDAEKLLQLSPYCDDRCGGFGFVSDLILSPTISALLVSGLAFFGVVYTHQALDVETATGVLTQVGILTGFYIVPTLALRSVLVKLKKRASREIHIKQAQYYDAILAGRLNDNALRDAHEYLRYFEDIVKAIDRIPNWPHLARVSTAFGVAISPALLGGLIRLGTSLASFAPSLR